MTSIWMDGKLVPEGEARVSLLAHTLHYGVGVFEGIRSYATEDGGAAIFRLTDHIRRLHDSARICHLELPFSQAALCEACVEVLQVNEQRDAYLRPIAWQDDGRLGGLGSNPPVHVAVASNPWGAYLGEEGLAKGIRCIISSYRRAPPGSFLSRAKICGQYVTSTLAKRQAVKLGFHEALLTDESGRIAEGSGENLFVLKDHVLVTPPPSAPILPGLTRDTLLHLARRMREELGLVAVVEDHVPRGLLLTADEAFLTGTAAEVTPIREVDGVTLGAGGMGPVTRRLQEAFFDLVRGRSEAPRGWRTSFGALVR